MIDSLHAFLGLARNLHYGRTSEEFHLSRSALSRLIKRLEDDVGYQLFVRDNRSVTLTPQGEIFRDFAQDTINRWEQLQVELGISEQRPAGKLTLFASVTASQSILPRVLSRFRQDYPDIQIQLETGYAVNALDRLREGTDVVVAAMSEEEEPRVEKKIIVSTPILAAVAIDLDDEQLGADGTDWSRAPLILPSTGQARDSIDEWLRRRRIKPNIYSEVAGNEAILSLVGLGCGVGFVPGLVLESSPLRQRIRILEDGPSLPDFHVGFCTSKRNLEGSTLVRAFWSSI
jgi:LysR family positive regulator for ilvC